MGKVDCEISETVIWRSIPWDDAVFDKPVGSSVKVDCGQLVKNWRPNGSLLCEGDLIWDVLELRRVVVEITDPDNHWDCLPLLGPEYSAGHLSGAAFMRRATKRAFNASRTGAE